MTECICDVGDGIGVEGRIPEFPYKDFLFCSSGL